MWDPLVEVFGAASDEAELLVPLLQVRLGPDFDGSITAEFQAAADELCGDAPSSPFGGGAHATEVHYVVTEHAQRGGELGRTLARSAGQEVRGARIRVRLVDLRVRTLLFGDEHIDAQLVQRVDVEGPEPGKCGGRDLQLRPPCR